LSRSRVKKLRLDFKNTSIFGDLEIVRRFEAKRAALVADPPDLPELEDPADVLGERRGGILDDPVAYGLIPRRQ